MSSCGTPFYRTQIFTTTMMMTKMMIMTSTLVSHHHKGHQAGLPSTVTSSSVSDPVARRMRSASKAITFAATTQIPTALSNQSTISRIFMKTAPLRVRHTDPLQQTDRTLADYCDACPIEISMAENSRVRRRNQSITKECPLSGHLKKPPSGLEPLT